MATIIQHTPETFFREVVGQALDRERVAVNPLTELYVVRLLSGRVSRGHNPDEALHVVFFEAMNATPTAYDEIRSVGDQSLMNVGWWWEYRSRSLGAMRTRHLSDLGRMAYGVIGSCPYDEIAQKFEGIADALARASTDASLATQRDLLQLYERWRTSQSKHIARLLIEHGFVLGDRVSVPS